MNFEHGYKAVIAYDPEIDLFRGEFVGLVRRFLCGGSGGITA